MSLWSNQVAMKRDLPAFVLDPSGDTSRTRDTDALHAAFTRGYRAIVLKAEAKYWLNPITMPDWASITSFGYQPNGLGGPGLLAEMNFSLASEVGITAGSAPTLRGVLLTNGAGSFNESTEVLSGTTASGIYAPDNFLYEDVQFALWYRAVRMGTATYYGRTNRVMFNRCAIGYDGSIGKIYDLDIFSPKSGKTNQFFTASSETRARNVSVFGGAIEGYGLAFGNFQEVSVFGTYFESSPPKATYLGLGAVGFDPGGNGGKLTLHGALVYMNYTGRFVNMSGREDCLLDASGNTFTGITTSGPIIYFLPSSGSVRLGADHFNPVIGEGGFDSGCRYVSTIPEASKFDVVMPKLPAGNTQASFSNLRLTSQQGWFMYPLHAVPAAPFSGQIVVADGFDWDPLSRAYGRPYAVIYQGDRWRAVGGGT
jgi:hypothetical protein